MKIAQLVLEGAPLYELKSQRIDAEMLSAEHEVAAWPTHDAELVHVYGPHELPSRLFRNFPRPYVAAGTPAPARLWFDEPRMPAASTSAIPEAIERGVGERGVGVSPREHYTIGVLVGRRNVRPLVDATAHRLARFREDVDWRLFDAPPTPEEMNHLHLWFDPALDERDLDGYTAEALASGLHVVATRTPVNTQRLDGGRAGFLAPPNDPNELTHAIVTALFKPEISGPKLEAARDAAARFDPSRRRDALLDLYRRVAG